MQRSTGVKDVQNGCNQSFIFFLFEYYQSKQINGFESKQTPSYYIF